MTTRSSESNTPTPGLPVCGGIDVALKKLDMARTDRKGVLTVDNDPAGRQKLIHSLKGLPVEAKRVIIQKRKRSHHPISINGFPLLCLP